MCIFAFLSIALQVMRRWHIHLPHSCIFFHHIASSERFEYSHDIHVRQSMFVIWTAISNVILTFFMLKIQFCLAFKCSKLIDCFPIRNKKQTKRIRIPLDFLDVLNVLHRAKLFQCIEDILRERLSWIHHIEYLRRVIPHSCVPLRTNSIGANETVVYTFGLTLIRVSKTFWIFHSLAVNQVSFVHSHKTKAGIARINS